MVTWGSPILGNLHMIITNCNDNWLIMTITDDCYYIYYTIITMLRMENIQYISFLMIISLFRRFEATKKRLRILLISLCHPWVVPAGPWKRPKSQHGAHSLWMYIISSSSSWNAIIDCSFGCLWKLATHEMSMFKWDTGDSQVNTMGNPMNLQSPSLIFGFFWNEVVSSCWHFFDWLWGLDHGKTQVIRKYVLDFPHLCIHSHYDGSTSRLWFVFPHRLVFWGCCKRCLPIAGVFLFFLDPADQYGHWKNEKHHAPRGCEGADWWWWLSSLQGKKQFLAVKILIFVQSPCLVVKISAFGFIIY